ncbi:OmpW/AlkL family protein [Rhodalgimonas zhirmunskyi]|uniref:Outer membrane beta-barrel protein n=1 Tax=Rhodalgimonas zhirmunskyi TaxID=2964767 RepID=A0AAJ1X6D7_9RHOB|nr:OmpW family outer membrane protein [Rhodoalgimonas zhirmunskyi]MDQ2095391.1 outer membrane beta-barrel protein [Rhodoalgimonas zhirmunskyi]
MKKTVITVSALTASAAAMALATALPAAAQDAGTMTLALGVGVVRPASDNGTLAGGAVPLEIGNNARPTIAFEYFIRDNIGLELLGATPFKHGLSSNGAYIGQTKHLPPTLSINYHIPTGGKFTPFVGAGINYTVFFDESSPLGNLKIDDSVGFALHAGVDYALSDKGALRADLRYIQIEPDVSLNGASIGTAKINPLVAGVAYVMKF